MQMNTNIIKHLNSKVLVRAKHRIKGQGRRKKIEEPDVVFFPRLMIQQRKNLLKEN